MPFEPAFSITIESGEAGFDFTRLPDRPGVIVFEAGSGDAALLSTTANVRRAAVRRLGPQPEDDSSRCNVDLRQIVRRIRAETAGGPFEADAVYLHHARLLRPEDHRAACEHWQAWFLQIDPDERFPRWTKVSFPGWRAGREAMRGAFIGPFPDKHAAARCFEALDDLFDLCRHYHILVQAPEAQACPYKEMGRCPAPCDGSESMATYRARVAAAVRFARGPIDDARAGIEQAMRAAAAGQRYEEARRERLRLDATDRLARPAFRFLGALEDTRFLVVGRSERRGWARLTLALGGALHSVADVDAAGACAAVEDLRRTIARLAADQTPFGFTDEEQETLGLVCSRLFRKGRRAGAAETILRLPPGEHSAPSAPEILAAVRRAWRRRGPEDDGYPDRAIEALAIPPRGSVAP